MIIKIEKKKWNYIKTEPYDNKDYPFVVLYKNSDKNPVCLVCARPNEKIAEANAALIVQAPNLLDVAKDVEIAFERTGLAYGTEYRWLYDKIGRIIHNTEVKLNE